MTHNWLTDRFLYCCLSREQQEKLKEDLDRGENRTAYLMQQNLQKEKTHYRCQVCGKTYPFLEIDWGGERIDPKTVSKLPGKKIKYRKIAAVFRGDHYYALQKKSLLRFDLGPDGQMRQTDEIPVMGGVYQVAVSRDEGYLATETFSHTLAVIDLKTKQPVGKKTKCNLNGRFTFSEDNCLMYFFQDAVRCWDFRNGREEILFTVPEEWKTGTNPVHVVCDTVIYRETDRACLFRLQAWRRSWLVVVRDRRLEKVVPLPEVHWRGGLVYVPELDVYTLTDDGSVAILDGNGQILESRACPQLLTYSDGGGIFPITAHTHERPDQVFLSPDGRWMLLDYFSEVILVERETGRIRFCLYSYTGRVSQYMGFADNSHFWYTWGDSTYLQQIPEGGV